MPDPAAAPRPPARGGALVWMQGIVKRYGSADGSLGAGGATAVYALRGVDLRIDRGEYVAIVGPSGSGKSTLMNLVGCLDIADYGRYVLAGVDVSELRDDALAKVRNRYVGFVFQQWNLLARTSAVDNVALPLAYRGDRNRRRKALAALKAVGLEARAGHHPNQLSGGEQQRVAIARALVTDPAILLADEPTGSLDSTTGAGIMRLFGRLHELGRTVIVVTPDPRVAALAERQIHLLDGRIVVDAATDSIEGATPSAGVPYLPAGADEPLARNEPAEPTPAPDQVWSRPASAPQGAG
ncbi:MAG TPA: ABC transporter ATP-binding protein [Candidatus Binatus sp.]|nr:ABC transporter ATP-binding protein [Candidatus Binatus sp.]